MNAAFAEKHAPETSAAKAIPPAFPSAGMTCQMPRTIPHPPHMRDPPEICPACVHPQSFFELLCDNF